MPTRGGVIALLVAVSIAGCNVPSSTDSTQTVTAAPVPESTPRPIDRATGMLAPGVDASGVTSPRRLASAHADALGGTSYTVNQTILQRTATGAVTVRYGTRVRVAADPGRFRSVRRHAARRDGTLRVRHVERYGDGELLHEAVTENGSTDYRLARRTDGTSRDPRASFPWNLTNRRSIERLFSLVETNVTDRVTTNGTRYVRVETAEPAALPPLENVTLSAVVSRRGLVRTYRVTYAVERDGTRVETIVEVSYDGVGSTTIDPPGWLDRVDEVPRNSTA